MEFPITWTLPSNFLPIAARGQLQKAVTPVRGKQTYQICPSHPALWRPPPHQSAGIFLHRRQKRWRISNFVLPFLKVLCLFRLWYLFSLLPLSSVFFFCLFKIKIILNLKSLFVTWVQKMNVHTRFLKNLYMLLQVILKLLERSPASI